MNPESEVVHFEPINFTKAVRSKFQIQTPSVSQETIFYTSLSGYVSSNLAFKECSEGVSRTHERLSEKCELVIKIGEDFVNEKNDKYLHDNSKFLPVNRLIPMELTWKLVIKKIINIGMLKEYESSKLSAVIYNGEEHKYIAALLPLKSHLNINYVAAFFLTVHELVSNGGEVHSEHLNKIHLLAEKIYSITKFKNAREITDVVFVFKNIEMMIPNCWTEGRSSRRKTKESLDDLLEKYTYVLMEMSDGKVSVAYKNSSFIHIFDYSRFVRVLKYDKREQLDRKNLAMFTEKCRVLSGIDIKSSASHAAFVSPKAKIYLDESNDKFPNEMVHQKMRRIRHTDCFGKISTSNAYIRTVAFMVFWNLRESYVGKLCQFAHELILIEDSLKSYITELESTENFDISIASNVCDFRLKRITVTDSKKDNISFIILRDKDEDVFYGIKSGSGNFSIVDSSVENLTIFCASIDQFKLLVGSQSRLDSYELSIASSTNNIEVSYSNKKFLQQYAVTEIASADFILKNGKTAYMADLMEREKDDSDFDVEVFYIQNNVFTNFSKSEEFFIPMETDFEEPEAKTLLDDGINVISPDESTIHQTKPTATSCRSPPIKRAKTQTRENAATIGDMNNYHEGTEMSTFGGELMAEEIIKELDFDKGERIFVIPISLTSHLVRNVIQLNEQTFKVVEDARYLGGLTLMQSSGFIVSINHEPVFDEDDKPVGGHYYLEILHDTIGNCYGKQA